MNLQHSTPWLGNLRYVPSWSNYQPAISDQSISLTLSEQVKIYTDEFAQTQDRLAAISELDLTLRRLRAIQEEDFESEEEREITLMAMERAERIIAEAAANLEIGFQRGWASPHPDLGVRVEWENEGRHLRLIIGASDRDPGYVYREDPSGTSEASENVSAEALSDGLRWVLEQPVLSM